MPIRRRLRRNPTDRPGPEAAEADVAGGRPTGTGITVGVTGQPLRATVSSTGDVTPWGAGPTLSWFVAADDRWHVPSAEPTVRQRRIEGTPVVETRIRIPDGDAVQRVWAAADGGGLTLVEVENESPLPFAVAFAGAPVLTSRPPADVPVKGIDLPDDAIVLPVGHRASVRVALATTTGSDGPLPPASDAAAVVRGWLTVTERASRLELPDETLVEAVTAARCDLLLDGPVDAGSDPVGFLLDVGELIRLGEDAGAWLPEIVEPVEVVARRPSQGAASALLAAGRVARAAGDQRATADVERVRARLPVGDHHDGGDDRDGGGRSSFAELARGVSAGRFVHEVESLLATGGALLPAGMPTAWRGHDWAAHGVPTGVDSSVSFAIRWHGERPAILWEQDGPARPLTAPACAPGWDTNERAGEALWPAPGARSSLRVTAL